jgi:hypothetical protein
VLRTLFAETCDEAHQSELCFCFFSLFWFRLASLWLWYLRFSGHKTTTLFTRFALFT